MNNHYCSQKFNWAQVSMFDGRVQSCCQAAEDSPTLNEIKSKTIGFFNYPKIRQDRLDTLADKKISGCQQCWNVEDQGLISRRQVFGNKTYIDSVDDCEPDTLNLVISNTCALTCVYCCKKYSHSWRADLIANGDYEYHSNNHYHNDNRYVVTERDKVLYKLSQKQLENTSFYSAILEQLKLLDSVKTLSISGGELFLTNNLFEVLDALNADSTVLTIHTGLGVSQQRLQTVIKRLQSFKNLTVQISGENVGSIYEFVRYGHSYQNFHNNIQLLVDNGFTIKFGCSISNLSVFNFLDFVKQYVNHDQPNMYLHMVNEPAFMSPSVLDDHSKQQFVEQLQGYSKYFDITELEKTVLVPCTDDLRISCKKFVLDFASRRNLSMNIFPKTFIDWLTK